METIREGKHQRQQEQVSSEWSSHEGTLLWRTHEPLPRGIVRPHVVKSGPLVYLGGGFTGVTELTRSVFEYSVNRSDGHRWRILPMTPCHTFGMVLINDLITIVGGVNIVTGLPSAAIFSFVPNVGAKGKWCSLFPAMPSRRSCCSALCAKGHLIVAGGVCDLEGIGGPSCENKVEIMDIEAKQWYTAASLPKPVMFMTLIMSEKSVYLSGGLSTTGAIKDVFSCSISELIQNAKSTASDTAAESVSLWRAITQLPLYRSACCIVQGTLVAFGGMGSSGRQDDPTDGIQSCVYAWNSSNDTWRKLGDMPSRRTSCTAVLTGPSQVLVAGGYNNAHQWSASLLSEVFEAVNITMESETAAL